MEKEGISGEFFIIDNGSRDRTKDIVTDDIIPALGSKYKINLISLDKNYGTTISRNKGLRSATGENIIICDSDTEYNLGSLSGALGYLKAHADVGIVAPVLYWGNGVPQQSARRFPTLFAKLLKVFNILFKLPLNDLDFYPCYPFSEATPVETAASACWIFRKELLNHIGYLDENIFYSPEDLDFCYRVWKADLKVVSYPYIKIYHHAQWISRKKPFSKHALSHFLGILYYFGKHKYIFRPSK